MSEVRTDRGNLALKAKHSLSCERLRSCVATLKQITQGEQRALAELIGFSVANYEEAISDLAAAHTRIRELEDESKRQQPLGTSSCHIDRDRSNPGNESATCSICGALLVCLSCGNHRDERFADLESQLASLKAEK
jgi:hypothetical protein